MSKDARSKSMIRGAAGLVGLIAVLAMPALASATPLNYTFDASNEAWGQHQNPQSQITSAGWLATGGNPGGHLSATDTASDAGCTTDGTGTPCNTLFFESPTLAVGGLTGNYGGTASFDLRSSVNPAFASEIEIGSTSLQALLSGVILETSGTTYHHLSIPLSETGAAWLYCATSCVPPSQAQFKALLAAADFISVNADVGPLTPTSTGETYDLDNVSLTDGLPQAPAKPKKKKCKKKKKKKRAAVAKKKKCKKKPKKRASVTSRRTENREF
jgi:hypothetical protein